MNLKRHIAALCIAIGGAFAMQAGATGTGTPLSQPNKIDINISWDSGLTAIACLIDANGKATSCGRHEMPREVGNIKKIIQGKFLSAGGVSWIVVSTGRASLCGFSFQSSSISCRRLNVPASLGNFDIDYVKGALYFSSKKPKQNSNLKPLTNFSMRFTKGVSDASEALQATIYNRGSTIGVAGFQTMMSDYEDVEINCGMPTFDTAGLCGDWSDAGTGGIAEGFGGIKCVSSPLVICVPPPTPPTYTFPEPIPPKTPLTLCSLLGFFCEPYSIPPPPPPISMTTEERKAICLADNMEDMEECSAYFGAFGSDTWRACKDRASAKLSDCFRAAEGK